jgi:glycosyltransferase involved in cell wall biosynthesis
MAAPMSHRTIACVMEQTLGNITHYFNLRGHENVLLGCTLRWLPIEYRAGRLPWTINGSWDARRELRGVLGDVDAIFVHTPTLAPLLVDLFRRKPTILSADGTPLNKRAMRLAYGLKPEKSGVEHSKRLVYREVFARAQGFVAWSNWTKQSFVDDYGCREEDVAVIPPGIDVNRFWCGERNHELPRILFVGGDFYRKGGALLLKVFRERLRTRAELIVVTRNDIPEEPGLRVYRNVEPNSQRLLELYREADIFALPTTADCYSLACMEALASGLPVVATNVGGIPDILQENKTGHLVYPNDAGAFGDALETLVNDPARRRAMGAASRQDALDRFDCRDNARKLFEFVCARC